MGINETSRLDEDDEKEEETYAEQIVQDKSMLDVMWYISTDINAWNFVRKVRDCTKHSSDEDYEHKWNNCSITEFIFLFRLECLVSRGIISEEVRGQICRIRLMVERLRDQLDEQRSIIEDAEDKLKEEKTGWTKLTADQIQQLKNRVEEAKCHQAEIEEKISQYDAVFDNYHLNDELDLPSLIAMTVSVDDKNMDLDSYINGSKTSGK